MVFFLAERVLSPRGLCDLPGQLVQQGLDFRVGFFGFGGNNSCLVVGKV
jgi:hypothetical protein